MFILLIPLSELIVTILIFLFIIVLAQIDISYTTTNMANENALGIFIIFFLLNFLIVTIITLFGYCINAEINNRIIVITNTLSVAYKAMHIGIYGFIWGTFMCIPSLVGETQLGILEQGINFIASLIIPLAHLLIQIVIWLPIILIEAGVSSKIKNVVLNLIIRCTGCAIYTFLSIKWLFGHSVPYLLDVCEIETIRQIYGNDVIGALMKIGFIQ